MKGAPEMSHPLTSVLAKYEGVSARLYGAFHAVLLLLRIYIGYQTALSGWNKLTGIDSAASYFEGLGIIWPTFSAYVSGTGEFVGGILLLLGLAARIASLVLIVNFLVAYVTAHWDQALALFSQPTEFVQAAPFLYLLTSVLVFVLGPGVASVDAAIGYFVKRRYGAGTSKDVAAVIAEGYAGDPTRRVVGRRELVVLSLTAVSGLIAGALLAGATSGGGGLARKDEKDGGDSDGSEGAAASDGDGESGTTTKEGKKTDESTTAQEGTTAEEDTTTEEGSGSEGGERQDEKLQEIDSQAPDEIQPTLLLEEPHVCCGLNTCKGEGKSGDNQCAGQGSCATAETHVCQGLNACKGQGGCGEYPGQNGCEGKGACEVPLRKKQWDIARPKFEKLMNLAANDVGKPPESCIPES